MLCQLARIRHFIMYFDILCNVKTAVLVTQNVIRTKALGKERIWNLNISSAEEISHF